MKIDEIEKKLVNQINEIVKCNGSAIIGIDGRCGSGKSTLAHDLQEKLNATVIHLDDFFLQPYQRTQERREKPGENVDYERFQEEVMRPLQRGEDFSYRKYDCTTQSFQQPIFVKSTKVTIIEGSYSMREDLRELYDYKIFVTVNPSKQLQRIQQRNLAKLDEFKEKWIPLEEAYFSAFAIASHCDEIIDTSDLF